MVDADCKGCGGDPAEAAEEKRERGEELSEDEELMLEEGLDPCPKTLRMRAEGPRSPCDVEYCEKCYMVGQVLSVVFAIGVLGALFSRYHEGILFGALFGFTEASIGVSLGIILVSALVWYVQYRAVSYWGYYPVLGPVFGIKLKPILPEKWQRDVDEEDYIPWMSSDTEEPEPEIEPIDEQDSGGLLSSLKTMFSGGSGDDDEMLMGDLAVPDDADESEKVRIYREEARREKKKRREIEREKKDEWQKRRQETKKKGKLEEKVDDLHQEKEELREEKEEIKSQNQWLARYKKNPLKSDAFQVNLLHNTGDGIVEVNGYWCLGWFKDKDLNVPGSSPWSDEPQEYFFAVIVPQSELADFEGMSPPKVSDIDSMISRYGRGNIYPTPEKPEDRDDIGYSEWLTESEEVWHGFNPPTYLHPGQVNWEKPTKEVVEKQEIVHDECQDEECDVEECEKFEHRKEMKVETYQVEKEEKAPRCLFEWDPDDMDLAHQDNVSPRNTLCYTLDGTYIPPRGDPKILLEKSHWIDEAHSWEQKFKEERTGKQIKDRRVKELETEKQKILRNMNDAQKRAEKMQERADALEQQRDSLQHGNSLYEKRYEMATAENSELEEIVEKQDKTRKDHRRRALTDGKEDDILEFDAEVSQQREQAEVAVLALLEQQGYGNFDYDELKNGEADVTRGEAIREFMNDDSVHREAKENAREILESFSDRLAEDVA